MGAEEELWKAEFFNDKELGVLSMKIEKKDNFTMLHGNCKILWSS
jgi:hypothetical protein